jgi:hypothetical protein
MPDVGLFHQGLWKLPVMSSTSSSQNDDSLRKSIGEQNERVVNLDADGFWKKIDTPSAGSGEISYVVVLCGDFIRDLTRDTTNSLYLQTISN